MGAMQRPPTISFTCVVQFKKIAEAKLERNVLFCSTHNASGCTLASQTLLTRATAP